MKPTDLTPDRVLEIEAALSHSGDRSCSRPELIEAVAADLEIDIEVEKRRIAKKKVEAATKERAGRAVGQYTLPGFNEAFDFEPDRLILGDNDRLVRDEFATFTYTNAETERSLKHSEDSARAARKKSRDNAAFGNWSVQQALAGRPESELTHGNFVREATSWIPAAPDANG